MIDLMDALSDKTTLWIIKTILYTAGLSLIGFLIGAAFIHGVLQTPLPY